MAHHRPLVGLLTLAALVAIAVGVTGLELPLPRLGGSTEQAGLPGVRALATSPLLSVGAGAPPGGELAFVAVQPGGNLVVTDARRRSVLRFDPSGHLLSEWGPALGDTTLDEPAGVATWGELVYVLDRGTPRIFRLDAGGRVQAVLDLAPQGTYGLNGLAVDADGNIYAADTGRNRILVFAPTGALLRQIGHAGSDPGGFTQPMMLAFAADGSFFVADWENSRIQRFDAASTPTDAWSTGFHPFGVGVDLAGRVFVPDAEHGRVEVYTPHGDPLGELGAGGVLPKQVALPGSPQPTVYALGSSAIVRIDLQNTPPPPQSVGSGIDVVSLGGLAVLVGIVLVAVLTRRGRQVGQARLAGGGSVDAALEGPVGLHAKNGAQTEQQQPGRDQQLLLANQPERKQQPGHQDDQAKAYRGADHHHPS